MANCPQPRSNSTTPGFFPKFACMPVCPRCALGVSQSRARGRPVLWRGLGYSRFPSVRPYWPRAFPCGMESATPLSPLCVLLCKKWLGQPRGIKTGQLHPPKIDYFTKCANNISEIFNPSSPSGFAAAGRGFAKGRVCLRHDFAINPWCRFGRLKAPSTSRGNGGKRE